MAFFPSKKVVITPATLLVVVFLLISSSSAQLSDKFFAKSCPKLLDIVKSVVQSAIEKESRIGASLLRLHFHDCFVNGCDGSNLLDDTPSLKGEKTAVSNKNSARGFEVVDAIKSAVEKKCPGVVSCADILAIAARDSVVLEASSDPLSRSIGVVHTTVDLLSSAPYDAGMLPQCWLHSREKSSVSSSFSACSSSTTALPCGGAASFLVAIAKYKGKISEGKPREREENLEGPFWEVKLGRTDAKYASLNAANKGIPLSNWTLHDINSTFNALGLSTKDLVALSGAHTMRRDRESNFGRSLDLQTQIKFNNNYFSNLDVTTSACHQKFLEVEQTKSIATTYSNNVNAFNNDFADAMIKMGDILPPAGFDGEIRKNCRRAN
ncbi:hypothetical protein OROMI_027148 [Orobanche minor]